MKNIYFSDRLYTEDEKPKEFRFNTQSNNYQNCQVTHDDMHSNTQPPVSFPISSQPICNNDENAELLTPMTLEKTDIRDDSHQRPPSPATQTQASDECWD